MARPSLLITVGSILAVAWIAATQGPKTYADAQAWWRDTCPRADDFYRGLERNRMYGVRAVIIFDGKEQRLLVAGKNEADRCVRFPAAVVPPMPPRHSFIVTLLDHPAYLWRSFDLRLQ